MNYKVLNVINPDNLKTNSILVARGKAVALPENAYVLFGDNYRNNPIPHILVDDKEYKFCSLCGKWLPLWHFYKCKHSPDGKMRVCADCFLAKQSKYRKAKR